MDIITLLVFVSFLWLFYRLIDFWILHPWRVYRHFLAQGIPGRYTPVLGEFLARRRAFLAETPFLCAEQEFAEMGEYYSMSFGPLPCLNVSDPKLIECVLKTNNRFYCKSESSRLILSSLLGTENVLLAEGPNHTRHRRLLNPVFQHQNITSMISMMAHTTSTFFDNWTHEIERNDQTLVYNVAQEMANLTLDIVTGCVFGDETMVDRKIPADIYKNMTIALEETEKRVHNMILLIPIINQLPLPGKRRIDRCQEEIRKIVLKIIDQRRKGMTQASCKGPDLLDLLLQAKGDDQKQTFTDKEISDEALTFILAGHETTATLMSWTLYNLATNPDVYDRCQNEIDSVLRENVDIDASLISRLTYTEAVLKETLRHYQPVPILDRKAIADNTIVASDGKQIHIKKGTDIVMHIHITHHSSKYWEDPDQFKPERFLAPHSNIMFPFGFGPRMCIGQNFAMLEAKIILALALRRFHFELVPGQKLVPDTAITIRPRYGLSMRVSAR